MVTLDVFYVWRYSVLLPGEDSGGNNGKIEKTINDFLSF